MKNMHYYIVTLVVLLFMVAPAKAASEAEFGKLHKTYILHTDGSQEMRVQKERNVKIYLGVWGQTLLRCIYIIEKH